MREDTKEDILTCLSCKKENCTNCMAYKGVCDGKARKTYMCHGEEMTMQELADDCGVTYKTFYLLRYKHKGVAEEIIHDYYKFRKNERQGFDEWLKQR